MLEVTEYPTNSLHDISRSIFGSPPKNVRALRQTPPFIINATNKYSAEQHQHNTSLLPELNANTDIELEALIPSSHSLDPLPPFALSLGEDPEASNTSSLILTQPTQQSSTLLFPTSTITTTSPRILVPIISQSPGLSRAHQTGQPKKKVTWPDEAEQGGALVHIKHVERLTFDFEDEYDLAQTYRPRAPKWLRFLMRNKYLILLSCFGVIVCALFGFLAFSVL